MLYEFGTSGFREYITINPQGVMLRFIAPRAHYVDPFADRAPSWRGSGGVERHRVGEKRPTQQTGGQRTNKERCEVLPITCL